MSCPLRAAVSALLIGALAPCLAAQNEEPTPGTKAEAEQEPELSLQERAAQFLKPFHPKTGDVQLGDLANIKLGEGWLWCAGRDGQNLLVEFGNERDSSVRGVALPPDFAESQVFAVYSYSDEGHVKDEEPDYDELLVSMKEGAIEENEARREHGYPTYELVGWAEPPHYDKQEHKLYWAKELMFEGSETATLNYSVRVLGRTGTLEINGVGGIEQLKLVDKHCKELLRVTEFVEGKRYSDFDPEYDKIAAYGIGGLIAGKLALKVGLFAKLGIFLLKFLKPLLIGLVVLGGAIFKIFGGRKQAAEGRRLASAEQLPPVEE